MGPSDVETKVVEFNEAGGPEDSLPFRVELWDRARSKPNRVIGRAATIVLAQAIFSAAQADFSGERITLSRGLSILMDTH
jgi:hypothetical protein